MEEPTISAANTEVTESINSLSGYRVNEEKLQTALEELEFDQGYNDEGGSTFEPQQLLQDGEYGYMLDDLDNQMGQPLEFQPIEPPLPYYVPEERGGTPQFMVEQDEILTEENLLDGQAALSIEHQAEEFLNRLVIHRNALVDVNAQVDSLPDYYNYNDINYAGLTSKPTNFLVIGKPGVGLSTFAIKFAEKMNLVYISPATAVEYFNTPKIPKQENGVGTQNTGSPDYPEQFQFAGLDDKAIFEFIAQRIEVWDVHHRGYILDGWPIVTSEDLPVEEQIQMLRSLKYQPDIVFLMQMQDQDLFKRRIEQKLDPVTNEVYTKKHYIRASIVNPVGIDQAPAGVQVASKESFHTNTQASVTTISSTGLHDRDNQGDTILTMKQQERDFVPLPAEVVGRLISRLEDHPVNVKQDFYKFNQAIPALQAYINILNRTRVFELDAYFSPRTIMENAMDIMTALGILPSAIPVEIFRPIEALSKRHGAEDDAEGYFSDSEGCIPDPNDPDNVKKEDFPVDWEVILRSVVVRGRIDPRFRWHISQWKNLCPVALKEGRSLEGRPQLAYGMHDKVYFLSSEEAVSRFKFNPRQYLVKTMPTSPVKFFIVGHPLAGKTIFAKELAKIAGGTVIDMKLQVKKRLELVKQTFLFKARFDATMAAKKVINKQNYEEWKRQERNRRERVEKWIADYIRRKAAEEVNRVLAEERENRMKQYRKWRYASEFHGLSAPFKSPCGGDQLSFSWKKFVEDIKKGIAAWTHQERLELAWELFRDGKLRYKTKRKPVVLRRLRAKGSEDTSLAGESDDEDEEEGEKDSDEDEEEPGEGDEEAGESVGEEEVEEEEETKKKRRRRKKPYCKKPKLSEVAVVTEDELDSDAFASDAETDESIRMKYPEMCPELTEAVPRPGEVEDQNEQVQAYVKKKLEETEKWVETLPSEIYEEILQMALRDAEKIYKEKHPYAHFSGGWIVENLIQDVEKWRSILRKPELCPDQIFVLQDTTGDYAKISRHLKQKYIQSNPGRKISIRRKRIGDSLEGEFEMDLKEDLLAQYLEERKPEELEANDQIANMDELTEKLCSTTSEIKQLEMDRRRQRSLADSDTDMFTDDTERSISLPEPSGIFQFSVSPSFMYLSPECIKPWHTTASEKRLGIGPPLTKIVPAEMIVIVPLNLALGLTHGHGYANEDDGEDRMSQIIAQYQRPLSKKSTFQLSSNGDTTEGDSTAAQNTEFEGEEEEPIRTPSGLNTPNDFKPGLECIGEDDCVEKESPASIKKTFFKQISAFNEFWNMVYPVLKEQKVNSLEVGVVEEDHAKAIAQKFWNALEARFALPPKSVTAGELEEEDADVEESKALWTGKAIDAKDDGEGQDEDAGEGEDVSDEEDNVDRLNSKLRGLDNNPELFRRTLEDIEKNRLFGDFKYYCPVTLYDQQLIRKGNPKYAVKYQERLYYFVSHEASERFKENPTKFLPPTAAKCVPPPRICITGAPACGQREVGLAMSQKAGIYFIDFRERLQEIIKSRLGKNVGPFHTGTIVTVPDSLPGSPTEADKKISLAMDDMEGESADEWDANMEFQRAKIERKQMEMLAMKSLGLLSKAEIASYPMDSIERAEIKAREIAKDDELSKAEQYVKAFLESGTQLPSYVLDEFIPTLWNEEPFKSKGFILAGFPNTAKDIQYLADRGCYPEKVYIMECQKKTCRNRLIQEAVKLWHSKRNPWEKKTKPKILYPHQQHGQRTDDAFMYQYQDLLPTDDVTVDIWCNGDKVCVRAGKVLHHYHYIFTQLLKGMKYELNHKRIPWTSINTDLSLFEGMNQLSKLLTPALKHRRNFFESTYVLYNNEAEALLQNRYFHLTRFKRFDPVEVYKGNQGINLWNAPGVIKYPVLYRNYIYFIAGDKNLETFQNQVLDITEQMAPLPSVPFHIVVLGPPKSGKTELARRIASKLGLLYVQEDEVIERIILHSLASTLEYEASTVVEGPQQMVFSQMIMAYLKKGKSVPPYMYYRSLDFALLDPLAQHHGCVFDGYPMEDTSIQILLEQGIIPAVIIKLDIDLETALKRCESLRRIPNYDYKDLVQDSDDLIRLQYEAYGPNSSPCIFWYGDQMQCLYNLNGRKNPIEIYNDVATKCIEAQTVRQHYILSYINQRANQL